MVSGVELTVYKVFGKVRLERILQLDRSVVDNKCIEWNMSQ